MYNSDLREKSEGRGTIWEELAAICVVPVEIHGRPIQYSSGFNANRNTNFYGYDYTRSGKI
jgi:hypothetical protein